MPPKPLHQYPRHTPVNCKVENTSEKDIPFHLFPNNVAQDIPLKSLQSGSEGLDSVRQLVQAAAKGTEGVSGESRRVIIHCSFHPMFHALFVCISSVCDLSPWQ